MTLLEQLTQKLAEVLLCISSTQRAGANGLRNADEVAAALMPIIEGGTLAKPAYPLSLSDMVLTYGADRKNWPTLAEQPGADEQAVFSILQRELPAKRLQYTDDEEDEQPGVETHECATCETKFAVDSDTGFLCSSCSKELAAHRTKPTEPAVAGGELDECGLETAIAEELFLIPHGTPWEEKSERIAKAVREYFRNATPTESASHA